jgi:hypothetical protein
MHAPYQTAPTWRFIWYNISRPISKQTRKYENSHSVLFSFKLSMIEKLWTKTIQLSLETQKEKTQLTKVVTRGNDSATLTKPSSTFKGFV